MLISLELLIPCRKFVAPPLPLAICILYDGLPSIAPAHSTLIIFLIIQGFLHSELLSVFFSHSPNGFLRECNPQDPFKINETSLYIFLLTVRYRFCCQLCKIYNSVLCASTSSADPRTNHYVILELPSRACFRFVLPGGEEGFLWKNKNVK